MEKRQYKRPLMIAEEFSADQYVAICALPAQYLYADAIKSETSILGVTYSSGSDGVFQDESHVNTLLQRILNLILNWITGSSLESVGEYMGIRTTDSPSQKGKVVTLNWMTNYPIYGSENQLNDGQEYNRIDLRGSLKKNDNDEYYIQGNMS